MPYNVPIEQAQAEFSEYKFVCPLTPSEQKVAFHVKDKNGKDLCLKIIAPNCNVDRIDRAGRTVHECLRSTYQIELRPRPKRRC